MLASAKVPSSRGGVAKPVAGPSRSDMVVKRETVKVEDEMDEHRPAVQIINRQPSPPPLVQILLPSYPAGVYCSLMKVSRGVSEGSNELIR